LFEDELDARWFWEEGYKERLFKTESCGETHGYDKMTLWLNGNLAGEKSNRAVRSISADVVDESVRRA